MEGLPFVNPALAVEAVGFAPWQGHWLGVMLTPWFMNLILAPRDAAALAFAAAGREAAATAFRRGTTISSAPGTTLAGDYQLCSLFSPVLEFEDQPTARLVAQLARDALFDAANAEPCEMPVANLSPARDAGPANPGPLGRASPRRSRSATSCAAASRATIVPIEGELVVRLDRDGRHLRRVTVRLTRPMVAARVLTGRSAADAAATMPLLFSLCGDAQGAAAACALAAAGATGCPWRSRAAATTT